MFLAHLELLWVLIAPGPEGTVLVPEEICIQ